MMGPEKAGGKATLSATGPFGASLSGLLGGVEQVEAERDGDDEAGLDAGPVDRVEHGMAEKANGLEAEPTPSRHSFRFIWLPSVSRVMRRQGRPAPRQARPVPSERALAGGVWTPSRARTRSRSWV